MRNINGRELSLVLLTLFCVNLSFGQENTQKIESWRLITPLVSTRQQVERLLGSPVIQNDIYDADGFRITIWYSGGPDNGSCKWDVPNDTVIRMVVSPKKRPLLSQAGFELSQFEMRGTLDDEVWNYVNEEKGILINTYNSSPTNKTVIFLEFFPTEKEKKEKCLPKKCTL